MQGPSHVTDPTWQVTVRDQRPTAASKEAPFATVLAWSGLLLLLLLLLLVFFLLLLLLLLLRKCALQRRSGGETSQDGHHSTKVRE